MTLTQSDSSQYDPPQGARLKRALGVVGVIFLGVMSAILLLGLLPISTRGLEREPDPADDYEDAVTRFRQIEQAEQGIVNKLGHSRLLDHGERLPRVYIMIHGITNSPEQWRELGETLHDRGRHVLILRMPYHGLQRHQVSELKGLKPQDLKVYADEAVDIAAGLGDEIVAIGISGGGTVASWMAQNRPEVDQALLLAPFYGIHGLPDFATTLLMNAFSRLPNIVLDDPLEPRRAWVYRGQATRGVAAFLALGQRVIDAAKEGARPAGQVIVVTTARDNTANNGSTAGLLDLWRQAGVDLVTFQFEAAQDIPHNSVDPAADPVKKQLVYEQMLELLGEGSLP